MKLGTVGFKIFRITINSPALLTEIHNAAYILGGGEYAGKHIRLFGGLDGGGVGVVSRVVKLNGAPVRKVQLINNAGRGGNKVKVVFPLQTFQNNLHMKKPEEAAAEAEAQGGGGFRLKAEGGVVQGELVEGVPQVGIFRAVKGVNSGVNHGANLLVAGQRLCGRVFRKSDGVAHGGIRYGFD